jgi:murein DD-endopeptidase MepM/ murein hydrolase activator NlpD
MRLVLNTGTTGLRLVMPDLDARLAIADVGTFTRELPDPTRTPKPEPKKTPKPTPTAPPTPPRLTAGGYAFPVVGEVTYTNDWGAPRASTGTHVGNDIFGEFGAPAVAVRDGRLTKVGTLDISGNRLWLIDDNGDAYFYAHLSSFANVARNGARVQAGDVLGFIGNTGDAEPTPPHLHFEVHPGGLNEAPVNPFPILKAWQRREDVAPGAWAQRLGADAAERPGALVTVRDFIAE